MRKIPTYYIIHHKFRYEVHMDTLTREKIVSALTVAAQRDISSGTSRDNLFQSLARVIDADILNELKKRV